MVDDMSLAIDANKTGSKLVGLPRVLVQSKLFDERKVLDLVRSAEMEKWPLIRVIARDHPRTSRKVAETLSRVYEMPLVDLEHFQREQMPPESLQDSRKIEETRAVPVFVRGPKMFIATSDPTNTANLDYFTHRSGKRAEFLVVDDAQIQAFVAMLNGSTAEIELAGADVDLDFTAEPDDKEDEVAEGDDNPVVRFVSGVLLTAIRKGASDIHFEPYEKFYRVRIRVDGALQDVTRPAVGWGLRIASRIKVISNLDISEKRKPQDGRMKIKLGSGRSIDFRVSTLPTMYGEKIVIRILDNASTTLGIDALGYEPEEKRRLLEAIQRPYGMVLVTGPTGSGKTVSLYTCLNILNNDEINISTAEDPCEIQMPGINQVNVNPAAGLTFAAALRSFLRQDPDVIMVGEIRDEETAEISVKAAQTGHMVLATLHTNDAPKTLSRLIEIGVKPYNVASAVILITAQRLVRKLCESCKIEHEGLVPEMLVDAGMEQDEAAGVYKTWTPYTNRKEGCDSCSSGYRGRVGVYQVMPISEAIQSMIMRGADAMEISRQAQAEGVRDLRQSGLVKFRRGLTSLQEVINATNQ